MEIPSPTQLKDVVPQTPLDPKLEIRRIEQFVDAFAIDNPGQSPKIWEEKGLHYSGYDGDEKKFEEDRAKFYKEQNYFSVDINLNDKERELCSKRHKLPYEQRVAEYLKQYNRLKEAEKILKESLSKKGLLLVTYREAPHTLAPHLLNRLVSFTTESMRIDIEDEASDSKPQSDTVKWAHEALVLTPQEYLELPLGSWPGRPNLVEIIRSKDISDSDATLRLISIENDDPFKETGIERERDNDLPKLNLVPEKIRNDLMLTEFIREGDPRKEANLARDLNSGDIYSPFKPK